jgi:hypothetical protein
VPFKVAAKVRICTDVGIEDSNIMHLDGQILCTEQAWVEE